MRQRHRRDRRRRRGRWWYSGTYYFLAHLSKFVRPGARRLGSTLTGAGAVPAVQALAFQNADGGFVLEALNAGEAPRALRLATGGRRLDLALPPISISTLRWR